MSVTGHRDVRHPDDFYETPAWCTRVVLAHLQRGNVLDPCCGAGAIGKVIADEWRGVQVFGTEINEGRAIQAREGITTRPGSVEHVFDAVYQNDYLALEDSSPKTPLIITNPPFKLALEFAQKAIKEADTVAFLLRLNWLASEARRAFHVANPADLVVLPRRPSFAQFLSCGGKPYSTPSVAKCTWKATLPPTADRPHKCPSCGGYVKASTTDSTEYAWFIWGKGRGGRYKVANEEVDWDQVKRELGVTDTALDEAAKVASL